MISLLTDEHVIGGSDLKLAFIPRGFGVFCLIESEQMLTDVDGRGPSCLDVVVREMSWQILSIFFTSM